MGEETLNGLVLKEIQKKRPSPREIEKSPPPSMSSQQARVAVQRLLDDGTVKLDSELKLTIE